MCAALQQTPAYPMFNGHLTAMTRNTSSTIMPMPDCSLTIPIFGSMRRLSNKMAKADALGTKSFSSKADADAAFRKSQASNYSNHFTSQPSVRPAYIPPDVYIGSSHYNVTYYGGCYGYYDSYHHWTPLDMAMYMVVTDAMLSNSGEYYTGCNYPQPVAMTTTTTTTTDTNPDGQQVTTTTTTTAPTPVQPISGHAFLIGFIIVAGVIIVIIVIAKLLV
jgi:hypothetical protein